MGVTKQHSHHFTSLGRHHLKRPMQWNVPSTWRHWDDLVHQQKLPRPGIRLKSLNQHV